MRVYPASAAAARMPRRRPGARLVWAHGGGFVAGDLDMPEADWVARTLAARGVTVVSIDYRLAGDGWPLSRAAPTTCSRPGAGRSRTPTGSASTPSGSRSAARAQAPTSSPAPCCGCSPRSRSEQKRAYRDSRRSRRAGGADRDPLRRSSSERQRAYRDHDSWSRYGRCAAYSTDRPLPAGVFLAYPTLLAVQPAPGRRAARRARREPRADRFGPDAVRGMYEQYLGGPVDDAPLAVGAGRAAASDLVGFPPCS